MKETRTHRSRAAFTLIELMIAMAVIGILVGMLAYGVIPAFTRAREFSIQQEMSQIGQAIEEFKTKYGFYPPSFIEMQTNDLDSDGSVTTAEAVAALLPYINRIAPNHQEAVGAIGSRPIDLWWNTVGVNIGYDHGDDLVFWLSGLTKNKQFPLTGDGASTPNAYDDGAIQRDVFYDFRKGQLEYEGNVAHYKQPAGKEASFLYLDSRNYATGPNAPASLGGPLPFEGYRAGPQVGSAPNITAAYENPDTFQLITYGMDGLPGNPGDWRAAGIEGEDNICNFAGGRLDQLILGTASSTAN